LQEGEEKSGALILRCKKKKEKKEKNGVVRTLAGQKKKRGKK